MPRLKPLARVVFIFVVMVAAIGNFQGAMAQTEDPPAVVVRDLTYWDATYTGYVDANRFEKWPILFTETENFSVTATPVDEGLTTLIILLDSEGVELGRGSGEFTSSQPAGSYFVQIEPETGSGFYELTIRRVEVEPSDPSSTTTVEPSSVFVGESAAAGVSLDNIPEGGYSSAEFVCTFDPSLVAVSNIVVGGLFGEDSVSALNGPTDGTFIVAVAGSNGNRAYEDGTAFTFDLAALQAGDANVSCSVRVSVGENALTDVESTGTTLHIEDEVVVEEGTVDGQVNALKSVTVSLYNAAEELVATTTANEDGSFSLGAPIGDYTIVASASGYLNAEGSVTVVAEATTTKDTVDLLAGDIDGNGVVDQFDALTIGINYNGSEPAAADLNNDGVINVLDLELLAANYHVEGPVDWP